MATARNTYIVRNNENKIIDVRTTARTYTHSNGENYYGSYALACKAGDANAYPVQLADTAELKKEASHWRRVGQYVGRASRIHEQMKQELNRVVKALHEGNFEKAHKDARYVIFALAEGARNCYTKAKLDVPQDVIIYSSMATANDLFAHLGFDNVPALIETTYETDINGYTLSYEGETFAETRSRKIGTRREIARHGRYKMPVTVDVIEYYCVFNGEEYTACTYSALLENVVKAFRELKGHRVI